MGVRPRLASTMAKAAALRTNQGTAQQDNTAQATNQAAKRQTNQQTSQQTTEPKTPHGQQRRSEEIQKPEAKDTTPKKAGRTQQATNNT